MSRRYLRVVVVSALLSLLASLPASLLATLPAKAEDIAVSARFDSDWFYNGLSESRGEPAVGASVDWQLSEHFFIGAYGHEVLEDDLPVPRAASVFAGAGLAVNDSWYLTGTVTQRWFPGSRGEWDYQEFQSAVYWSPTVADQLRINLTYSDDFYHRGVRSLSSEASYQRSFGDRWYTRLAAGAMRFSDSGTLPDYEYLQIGGGYRIASFTFDLSWRANSEGNDTRVGFGRLESPSLVGQVVWRIW